MVWDCEIVGNLAVSYRPQYKYFSRLWRILFSNCERIAICGDFLADLQRPVNERLTILVFHALGCLFDVGLLWVDAYSLYTKDFRTEVISKIDR